VHVDERNDASGRKDPVEWWWCVGSFAHVGKTCKGECNEIISRHLSYRFRRIPSSRKEGSRMRRWEPRAIKHEGRVHFRWSGWPRGDIVLLELISIAIVTDTFLSNGAHTVTSLELYTQGAALRHSIPFLPRPGHTFPFQLLHVRLELAALLSDGKRQPSPNPHVGPLAPASRAPT